MLDAVYCGVLNIFFPRAIEKPAMARYITWLANGMRLFHAAAVCLFLCLSLEKNKKKCMKQNTMYDSSAICSRLDAFQNHPRPFAFFPFYFLSLSFSRAYYAGTHKILWWAHVMCML